MRASLVALVLLLMTGLTSAAPPSVLASEAGEAQAAAARPAATRFAMQSSGYGSRANGGQVPTGSDTTGYDVIGCTNKAGITHENHQSAETLPDFGTAAQVQTDVWTEKDGSTVSSWSRNTIKRVEMTDSPLGTLEITNVTSLSRAYHEGSAFRATARTGIGSITFHPLVGPPRQVEIPTPGQPVDVPGVATLSVDPADRRVSTHRASVQTDALQIVSTASGTRTRIAHTAARIDDGVVTGVFGGWSSGSRGTSAGGNVTHGKDPYLVMPCQGTRGWTWTKSVDSSDLAGGLLAQGLTTQERGAQNRRGAWGFEQARVTHADLGSGRLTVDGIVGRVDVSRSAGGVLQRDLNGTTVGTITADGQEQAFPDSDVLEIPGVARLERYIVKKIKAGLWVIALRITLLDGSGTVYTLGEAKLHIDPRGR